MSLEEAAEYWSKQLSAGRPVYRVRVRRLLEIAGAKRRGFVISERIRSVLNSRGLETEPDFETAWIEAQLQIKLKLTPLVTLLPESNTTCSAEPKVSDADASFSSVSALDGADPGAEPVVTSDIDSAPVAEPLNSPLGAPGLVDVAVAPQLDAQVRFESVPSANRGVVSVKLTDSITVAITKMRFSGYSQLAIMQGDYQVSGMISWESIAKRFTEGPVPTTVADCREDAQVIDAIRPLYDGIAAIERFGYVLVRSKQNKITGIVTATDLLSEFGRLSFAFMRLRSIELSVRNKLKSHLLIQDFETLEQHSKARVDKDWELLTFGECARLLESPAIWDRLRIPLDKAIFTQRFNEIKVIRNEVMHFSPDPLDAEQKSRLDQMDQVLNGILG